MDARQLITTNPYWTNPLWEAVEFWCAIEDAEVRLWADFEAETVAQVDLRLDDRLPTLYWLARGHTAPPRPSRPLTECMVVTGAEWAEGPAFTHELLRLAADHWPSRTLTHEVVGAQNLVHVLENLAREGYRVTVNAAP